ncbi:MAG: hypothetical protein KBT01_04410 [Clostridiales bacterium]|nr:hypothetical protein [Candidatus Blautia equi]
MIKNKYKEDYQRIKAGQYEYVGKHYRLPMDEAQKKRTAVWNFAAAAGFFLLELAAGLLNADSSRTAWIVFPYLFMFLPTAYMALGAYAFAGAPIRMEHSAYENSLVRLRRSVIAIMVLGGICILLDLIFIAIHFREINLQKELLYILCFTLAELLGLCYGKSYDRRFAGLAIEE